MATYKQQRRLAELNRKRKAAAAKRREERQNMTTPLDAHTRELTIDITPDAAAQRNIAAAFVCQLAFDFKKSRRDDALAILLAVIDLAYVAGANAALADVAVAEKPEYLSAVFARAGGVPTR